MTVFPAHVENGAVVLDTPTPLPEGARLRVEVVEERAPTVKRKEDEPLGERLLKYAGTVRGLPSDMAAQHDHYIHGCPKQ